MTKRYTLSVTQDEYNAFRLVARCVGLFMPDEPTPQLQDPWREELEKWLANTPSQAVKITEVLGEQYTPKNASRVATILKELGWRRHMSQGQAFWLRPKAEEEASEP